MSEHKLVSADGDDKKPPKDKNRRSAYLERHAKQCSVCASPWREAAERAFINWVSPDTIAKQTGLSRESQYRHAHAFGLFRKRRINFRIILERVIENVGYVTLNTSHIISVMKLYAKMNSAELAQAPDDTQVTECMWQEAQEPSAQDGAPPEPCSEADLAQAPDDTQVSEGTSGEVHEPSTHDGALSECFSGAEAATPLDSQGGEKGGQVTETNTCSSGQGATDQARQPEGILWIHLSLGPMQWPYLFLSLLQFVDRGPLRFT